MTKNMKMFAALAFSVSAITGVVAATANETSFAVKGEAAYVCDGGSYEPATNLSNSNSGIALKAALSEDGFEGFIGEVLLKLNQLPKAKKPGTLSDYFETTVDANISGENAYSLDSNSVIIKSKGSLVITFKQPVIRVVAQIAVVNDESDVDNLNYVSCVYPVNNNSIKIDVAREFPNCKYIVVGKLSFRLPA